MTLLDQLFRKKKPRLTKADGTYKTSGELVADVTDGSSLVNGKQTWELVESSKNDLETMVACCQAELATMEKADIVAAPYYFERVAILSRKQKKYKQEIFFCEQYISRVEAYYRRNGTRGIADVRKGPRYEAIKRRLPKARELHSRHGT